MKKGCFPKIYSGLGFRGHGLPARVSTGRLPGASRGMTLVEVMVAMVILLVGVWAVAAAFPKLFGVLAGEEKRTEMSRLAEARVEQFKTDPYALPLSITGGPAIHPDSVPDDPDIASGDANSRDDILWVGGESFIVPATQVHVFKLGLAQGWVPGDPPLTAVYGVQPLTTINFNASWEVTFNPGGWAELSYTWRDTGGGVHYVSGEVVENGAVVAATGATGFFHSIVEGSAHGVGRTYFAVDAVTPPGGTLDPGEAVQDVYGATLLFDQANVGRRMRVDYWLRPDADSTSPRYGLRDLIMVEDRQISSAPQRLNLVGTGIDGTRPLFAFEPGAHMLAIDLNTGVPYYRDGGYGIIIYDYGRGDIQVNAPGAEGHTLRFYYRTTDQDTITVQKAPSTFLDAVAAPPASEAYRTYWRDDAAPPYTMLVFATCAAGQVVAVDYTWNDTSGPSDVIRTAVGEMHTINATDSTIRLNNDNVLSIIAVRGMSLKVRAWWRTNTGRLTYFDVDTILGLRPIS